MAALFFLAFAFFAVGQASAKRNSAQTAADAAALAAARETRDEIKDPFLAALTAGDLVELGQLLGGVGMDGAGACPAASALASENDARTTSCVPAEGLPGSRVTVVTNGTVGESVIDGTENIRAKADATAVVEARCVLNGKDGKAVRFKCNGEDLSVDVTENGFVLDLSMFFTVHLSK
ncbi:pilus assembly protein TadG-related protein [Streptomyces sp. RKAG293]|uniref:pilus assembly protein TadG-related protein n=1 Tax=Streptomyces sp. RKAG293 TaxID=2893403 RepID=UPI002033A7A0|nr:pilus assembly protein TadG-related protein [Streptomyces sp. RKAG293]MCM2421322.1 pilus assembly protein TadG-related protein [Streptomyces sp. RKAG293]